MTGSSSLFNSKWEFSITSCWCYSSASFTGSGKIKLQILSTDRQLPVSLASKLIWPFASSTVDTNRPPGALTVTDRCLSWPTPVTHWTYRQEATAERRAGREKWIWCLQENKQSSLHHIHINVCWNASKVNSALWNVVSTFMLAEDEPRRFWTTSVQSVLFMML